jgi:hypothetical protein
MGKLQAETTEKQVKAEKEQASIEPTVLEILSRIETAERGAKVKEDQLQLQTIKEMLVQLLSNEQDTGIPAGGKKK